MAMSKAPELLDINALREAFPILGESVNGRALCYLDNAATSQKPGRVVERMRTFYLHENANIHRGVHALSQRATEDYESARAHVGSHIGTTDHREIIFTRGATEAINLVAAGLAGTTLQNGDTVLITAMEHHANIVPWQLLRDRQGIRLEVVRVLPDGSLDWDDYRRKLQDVRPKLVSLVHISNSLGTINPAQELIREAHDAGARVLLDASQSVPHQPVNVRELDCDWLVFSGHKVFGPTGIGVLFGKYSLLEAMQPYQGGGDMIESVSFEKTIFKHPPERFEAGTPHIAGAIGLSEALRFLEEQDRTALIRHEQALLTAATEGLSAIPGLRIIGTAPEKASVVSFVLDAAHPHDIASFLDAEGIAIRSGHHCTQPLMDGFKIPGTARASFSIYNTLEEVDLLVRSVDKIRRFFG